MVVLAMQGLVQEGCGDFGTLDLLDRIVQHSRQRLVAILNTETSTYLDYDERSLARAHNARALELADRLRRSAPQRYFTFVRPHPTPIRSVRACERKEPRPRGARCEDVFFPLCAD